MIVKKKDSNDPSLSAMSLVISQRNKNIPQVERGLNPNESPKFENEDGSHSTHRMAAENIDGQWYVFPTLDYDKSKKEWLQFDDPFEAFKYHKQKGTLLKMPNKELALYYAENGLIKH